MAIYEKMDYPWKKLMAEAILMGNNPEEELMYVKFKYV